MMNKELLIESIRYPMPYGKYKGFVIADLPVYYLEWFLNHDGFPAGKLGEMMMLIYQIKLNGLEEIIAELKRSK